MSEATTQTKRSGSRRGRKTAQARPVAGKETEETGTGEAPVEADAPAESETGESTEEGTAEEAAPAEATGPDMDGLYKTLLATVKKAAKGVEVTEKAAYARVRIKVGSKAKTVVYVNHPSKKAVRLEFPKPSGGGYEVVRVASEEELAAAVERFKTDAEALTTASA